MRYNDERLVEFNRLREQRLQTLPLELLATTSTTQSSEPKHRIIDKPPTLGKILEKGKEPEQEKEQKKEQDKGSENINVDTQIDPKLLQEWQQFDSIMSNLERSKGADTPKATDT